MTTNTKISNLVSSQLPSFVRDEHETFVEFIKAYYEWLEQNGQTLDVMKNIHGYYDPDQAVDEFMNELQKSFISAIPNEAIVDKSLLIKHIKDFYRAKGSEKSVKFLLHILFGQDAGNTQFYYPKADILKASDGKWFVEKSLKISDVYIDGVLQTDNDTIKSVLKNTKVRGNNSSATALVERVDVYYDARTLVRELKISGQSKDFSSGEQLVTTYNDEQGISHTVVANTFSGIVNKVTIISSGTGYTAGTIIPVESNTGTGAVIQISSVTPGNIKSIYVVDGGAGFQNGDPVLITGGGGSGANAYIQLVGNDGYYHPNSYNVVYSTIGLEANTPIGNTIYANLKPSITDPANNWIANSMSYFVYGNTGPAKLVFLDQTGNNYTTRPDASVVANTRIRELGILGKMKIISGGSNYSIGDSIVFDNIPFGFGTGASANVTNVNASGSITEVRFRALPGFFAGGSGYDQATLPRARVVSATGTGANIAVTSILGAGTTLTPISDKIGAIQGLTIVSGGSGYETAPTLNLTTFGDGTAKANASIVKGAYSYPGRYLNDDGQLSAYNFLQDRDYYQNYSYVVKINRSLAEYRKYLKQLAHPSGLRLFGEFIFLDQELKSNAAYQSINTSNLILVTANYVSKGNGNTSRIEVFTQRNIAGITNAFVEFHSGNAAGNIANGYYAVTANSSNSYIFVYTKKTVNGAGTLYTSI